MKVYRYIHRNNTDYAFYTIDFSFLFTFDKELSVWSVLPSEKYWIGYIEIDLDCLPEDFTFRKDNGNHFSIFLKDRKPTPSIGHGLSFVRVIMTNNAPRRLEAKKYASLDFPHIK